MLIRRTLHASDAVCGEPVNKIESTCVGAHNDGRMCKFRPTAACVKTCGNFTIPGNATGRRNSGTSLPTNTVVTRLLGYETLVVTCDSNYRLNDTADSCDYEATLSCGADTGVLSVAVGGTTQTPINLNSLACVPVTCDTATARDGEVQVGAI